MKIKVISYSFTGNNEAMASKIAKEIPADHIQITEVKKRTMGTIIKDNLFNRNPKIDNADFLILENDFVIFISPIWLGRIASPMRTAFQMLKDFNFKYGFISISGGADGPDSNDKIPAELESLLGHQPVFVLDLHKADLLPSEPKPTRDMTMNYQIVKKDLDILTDSIKTALKKETLLRDYLA